MDFTYWEQKLKQEQRKIRRQEQIKKILNILYLKEKFNWFGVSMCSILVIGSISIFVLFFIIAIIIFK